MGNNYAVEFCDHVVLMLQVLISQENYGIRNTVVQENEEDVTERDDIKQNFNFPLDYFEVKYNQPLSLRKKLYEFYTAPITKFWGHAVSD
jgi:transient receptor potential cation channel subfamily M protein 3